MVKRGAENLCQDGAFLATMMRFVNGWDQLVRYPTSRRHGVLYDTAS
jgi:hypothetical protein